MVAAHLFDAPLTTSTAADLADTIMECLYKDGQGIAQTESILSSIMSGLRAAIESTRRSGLASYEASFVLGIHALYMSEDLRDFFAQKALDSLNTQHPLSMQQILRIMDHCRPSAGLREAYRARLETMLTQAETEPRRIRILETMIAGWSERYTTKENRLTVARYYFEDPSSSDFRHLYAANLADLGEGSPEILTALLSGIDVQQTVVDALGTFGPEQLQALDAVRLALESDYPVSASIALGLAGLRDPRLLETVLTSPRNWRDQDMLPRFLQRWVEDSPSDMARIEAAVDEVRPMAPEELRQAFPDGGDGVI